MSEKNITQPDTTPLIPLSLTERFFAMTAHFSQFLGFTLFVLAPSLFIPDFYASTSLELGGYLVGPFACLIIYLLFKNHSRFTSFQSLQAFIFQFILFIFIGVISVIFWDYLDGPEALLPGMCMVPFTFLWFFTALIGGIQSMRGKGFKYPIIGKWVN